MAERTVQELGTKSLLQRIRDMLPKTLAQREEEAFERLDAVHDVLTSRLSAAESLNRTLLEDWKAAQAETTAEVTKRELAELSAEAAEAKLAEVEKDAARYRWLCGNNFDRVGATQVHTWVHTWEPHSQTGEPTEWVQRIRGGALDAAIDAAMQQGADK